MSTQRQAVVDVANSWLGTPFHDCAGIKGVGVDCAHLIACVYAEAGVIAPLAIEPYSPQWFLHRSEERFMSMVLAHSTEIAEADVQPADIILYKVGRCFAHGAIIDRYPDRIIHAHKGSKRVVASHAEHAEFTGRERKFFTLWPGGQP